MMSTTTSIARVLHVLGLAVPILLAAACNRGDETAESAPCCAVEDGPVVPAALPDSSIYHLESVWRDQSGSTRRLSEFRGKHQVVSMIFTNCEYACPRTLVDLKAIEAGLTSRELESTRFLLISFDSERDTPEALDDYAEKSDLDLGRWTLITGAAADVREIAATLGVRFKASADVGFSHSNMITFLDPLGAILHQQVGLGGSPDAGIATLREALSAHR